MLHSPLEIAGGSRANPEAAIFGDGHREPIRRRHFEGDCGGEAASRNGDFDPRDVIGEVGSYGARITDLCSSREVGRAGHLLSICRDDDGIVDEPVLQIDRDADISPLVLDSRALSVLGA
jgi:hypothetical protein